MASLTETTGHRSPGETCIGAIGVDEDEFDVNRTLPPDSMNSRSQWRSRLRAQPTVDGSYADASQEKRGTGARQLRKRLTRTDTITFGGPIENFEVDKFVGQKEKKGPENAPMTGPPIRINHGTAVKPRSPRKGTLGEFVKKQILNIRKLRSTKGNCNMSSSSFSSCPNLASDAITSPAESKMRLSVSSEAGLQASSSSGSGSPIAGGRLLTVPDVFTTSYTYSTSPDTGTSDERQGRQHSAPAVLSYERQFARQNRKDPLKKSLSDNPTCRKGSDFSLPQAAPLSDYTPEPEAAEILEYLYLGNIESAYNKRLLCKLKIGSIIDMSGLTPEEVPASKKSDVPCMCEESNKHFRAKLCVTLLESRTDDTESAFEQINRFIEGGRRSSRRVLLHDYCGCNGAAAAVIQYLMQIRNMTLRHAFSLVMKQKSDIDMSPFFQHTLELLERRLSPQTKPSMKFRPRLAKMDSLTPKEAWADC